MQKLDSVLQEMRSFGFTEDKIQEILALVAEDVYDQIYLDLASSASDEQIDALAEKSDKAQFDTDVTDLAQDAAKLAYGEGFKDKLDEMFAERMKDALEKTKSIRKLYQEYMAGDPAAKKKVEDAQNSEEFKQLQQEMEAAGFDFTAAAAK